TEWDFSQFVPDFVVINLGTNDFSYTGADEERIADYTTSYVDFLKTVRSDNPDAHIICSLGVMGDNLYPAVEEAVSSYTSETGDTNVSAFHFTPHNGSTGYAADWHPTEATHEIAANELVEYIKSLT
ncbi:MAG: SGNH/GDSL hydrolase family protein, partial [Oscillospiraceae bacterium]